MSFPSYPEYKDSGVEWLGQVPAHWDVKRLKYLGESLIGLTYDPTEVVDEGEGTLVLRSSNVQNGKIVFDDNVFAAKRIPERLITQISDILICSRNGSRALIGKNALITQEAAGLTFGAFMTVFRSKSNRYLAHVFNSHLFEHQSGLFLTSTINQLTIGVLNNFEIPIPTKSEQTTIASFLEHETAKIDALVAEQQRLIELLKEKRQAVISHAVTKGLNPKAPMKPSGIEWLGDVPEHWGVVPLRWASSCCSGDSLFAEELEICGDEEHLVPVVGGNGVMGYTRQGKIDHPVLAVGRVGALCGNVHIVNPPAWITDNALILDADPRVFHLGFLSLILRHRNLNEIAARTAQPLITGTQVSSQRIPAPPLNEQQDICSFLNYETAKIDTLTIEAQRAIDLLQERRTALISAAVTGQIDVRNVKMR